MGNVEVRDVPEPVAGPGEVKIEVKAAGICGTDIHIYYDEYPYLRPPVVMGHELAGVVAEVGEGVTRVSVGDRVTSETYAHVCGACPNCRAGRINLCTERRSIGSSVNGAFAKFVIVPELNVHLLPDNVDFIAGALTEPLACCVRGALELTTITPGDIAVVSGPGTIGLLTVQLVKSAGAHVVVCGTNVDEARLAMAQKLGADLVVNVQARDPEAVVGDLTEGKGADIVLECSGAAPSAQTCLKLVKRGGQYTQIGLFGKSIEWAMDQVPYKELKVTGSNATVPTAWRRALQLMALGKVNTRLLASEILPLTEWEKGFELFNRKDGGKIILEPVD